MLLPFLHSLWRYRWEIAAAAKFISQLRKTAREATREYIRRRIEQKLVKQIIILGFQILALVLAYVLYRKWPTLWMRLFASSILWGITLYNLRDLITQTIPELIQVRRALKGKVGYALKYFLEISLVTELMEGNVLFLFLCVGLGISSRTWLGYAFAYFEPWVDLANYLIQL